MSNHVLEPTVQIRDHRNHGQYLCSYQGDSPRALGNGSAVKVKCQRTVRTQPCEGFNRERRRTGKRIQDGQQTMSLGGALDHAGSRGGSESTFNTENSEDTEFTEEDSESAEMAVISRQLSVIRGPSAAGRPWMIDD